ncbi:uncharacterized protein MEPE_01142 [Melanopsichium pennsylvanicum]|uniref:NudC domain-containing protein 1 n=2 Tax=Melanopsichium pennsylvanicum TaxID=63383 RepID=A0AAJ4XIS2_9BASI|nr:hypothetical protein BN887_05794 [Melanopsichium pennsylvanicum 4]SNX82436.1 uncharacterized protein MEPE_01142 [Melanopsichium pennsylvanicum]
MRNRNDGSPLYGWTFHQSHDQATVLFLVPQATSTTDLDIRIAHDHVVASVINHPPILQAKLYGRVNTETSTWRIADRDRARKRRSRSFARSSSQAAASISASGSAEAPFSRRTQPERHICQNTVPSDSASPGSHTSGSHVQIESSPPSQSSLSASAASLQSGSSYEVLSYSTPSALPAISAGPATERSSGSSDFGSSDSADASLNQSVVLSDPGDLRRHNVEAGSSSESSENPGLRRSLSISDLSFPDPNASATAFAAPEASPQVGPPEVRLVTIHLDKIDAGIWPLLVVGPAPLRSEALSNRLSTLLGSELPRNGSITEKFVHNRILHRRSIRQEQQQRNTAQIQLNQALEEALSAFEGGDRVLAAIRNNANPVLHDGDPQTHFEQGFRASMDSDEDFGPNTSTLSINTIGSDESATVLGSRVVSLSGTSSGLQRAYTNDADARQADAAREDEDELLEAWKELEVVARYNMDPTTLSLIGLQFANSHNAQRGSGPSNQTIRNPASGIPDAFEYFARAWRAADVSLATERLVQDFLPLLPAISNGAAHQDQRALHARLSEALEPALYAGATSLPATVDVVTRQLRERLHSHSYMSHRQRLVASLGGPKALARLYVSYARLRLPSLACNRSPLAFPYGQLTSPFVGGGHGGMHPSGKQRRGPARNPASSSSRTPSLASLPFGTLNCATSPPTRAPNSPTIAESSRVASPDHAASTIPAATRLDFTDFLIQNDHSTASQPPPFYLLREACLLDSDMIIQISAEEWLEAVSLALESEDRRAAELDALAQAEEMGSMAGDSESGCLTFESDSETQRCRVQRRSTIRGDQGSGGVFNLAWLNDYDAASRKRSGKVPRRTEKNKRRKERRPRSGRAHEEAGVINFVSGAALLGVALAGSVAALGWWRRTSAALNSSA